MKYIWPLLAASFLAGQSAFAWAERPLLVAVPVRHAFIPAGFDDNDDIQIVLEGAFADTCHKMAHTEVLKSEDGTSIEVIQWARKFSGICIPTTVPFKSEVSLGRLTFGTYRLESMGVTPKMLKVDHALVDTQDDFLYAPVTSASVARRNTAHHVVTLVGRLPNDCFSFDKTEVRLERNVMVVLPIIQYTDTGHCSQEEKPFERTVDLPVDLDAGKYLVHVRSMSGKAVNVVFFADGD